jgi:hypothetical protein
VTPFEYVLPMVSILIGLAVGDLSISLHRLLRARRHVRWDWLPMAAALLVLLLILEFWWAFYALGRSEVWTQYWAFLFLGAALVSIFLLASAALPDAIPEDGLDLAAYYDENRRYFWGMFGLFALLAFILDLLAASAEKGVPEGALRAIPTLGIAALLFSSRIRPEPAVPRGDGAAPPRLLRLAVVADAHRVMAASFTLRCTPAWKVLPRLDVFVRRDNVRLFDKQGFWWFYSRSWNDRNSTRTPSHPACGPSG